MFYPQVRVELVEASLHLCTAASKRGKYRVVVTVGEYSSRSVPFIIIPIKDGQHPIEIKASVKDSYVSDGIRKLLRVVVSKTALYIGWQPFSRAVLSLQGLYSPPSEQCYCYFWFCLMLLSTSHKQLIYAPFNQSESINQFSVASVACWLAAVAQG